ncbi:MAG: 16S rRNA (uracil(1498)-N(3))-methyltransferase [Calditrichaeota bacterium]|nr:MAG: 16S rRNA (uracil(1498)-N(3))-methyltransferase [Calditrichota bacterium]
MRIDRELFFLPELDRAGETVLLPEAESRHLARVLRKRAGELVYLTDGRGQVARSKILGLEKGRIRCRLERVETQPEPPTRRIQVGLGLIRPNRLDWAVEKLTELGVGRISLLQSDYCQPHSYKPQHLEKIAVAAIKQSRQTYLPVLAPPMPLDRWLAEKPGGEAALRLVGDRDGVPLRLGATGSGRTVVLLVGPEGGFSAGEQAAIAAAGFQPVQFARTILRSETAAVTGTAQLLSWFQSDG